jgi:hypothetical protein
MQTIASRTRPRAWHDTHPGLAEDTSLPIADMDDDGSENEIRISLRLAPGADPAVVRDQLLDVDGIGWTASWALPAPLASMLRSWTAQHRSEDLTASLTHLERAIRLDQEH